MKSQNADTDSNPKGHDISLGCRSSAGYVCPGRIFRIELIDQGIESSCAADYGEQNDKSADYHDDALYGIRRYYRLESADRRVNDNYRSEQKQSVNIGKSGNRFKKNRTPINWLIICAMKNSMRQIDEIQTTVLDLYRLLR